MWAAGRVVCVLGLCVAVAGCATSQPAETVILSQQKSAFDSGVPVDGKWRKSSPPHPVAILLGRATTSKVLLPRRAAVQASCRGGKPQIMVAFNVGLGKGPITVSYRFDGKVEQKGTTAVRGKQHNTVVIDYPGTAAAFLESLGSSSRLKVRAARPPFEMHDAEFGWDPADRVLGEVLVACKPAARGVARPPAPKAGAEEDDSSLDEAVGDVLSGGS